MKGFITGILWILILTLIFVPVSALEINRSNISPEYSDVAAFHSVDNASLALYEGQNALQAGRLEEALSAYTNATESDPSFMAAWYLKAYALTRLNRLAEALTAVDRALALDPGDRDSRNLKADILVSLGRGSEAAAYRATPSPQVTVLLTTPTKAPMQFPVFLGGLAGAFLIVWARKGWGGGGAP